MGSDEIAIRCVHCNRLIQIVMVLLDGGGINRYRVIHVGDRDEDEVKTGRPKGRGEGEGMGGRKKGRCKGMMDHQVREKLGKDVERDLLLDFYRRLPAVIEQRYVSEPGYL